MNGLTNPAKNKENLMQSPQLFPKIVRKLLPKILNNSIIEPLGFSFNRSKIIDQARRQNFMDDRIKYNELKKAILTRLPSIEKSVNPVSSISNNSFDQNKTFALKCAQNQKFITK